MASSFGIPREPAFLPVEVEVDGPDFLPVDGPAVGSIFSSELGSTASTLATPSLLDP